MIIYYIMSSIVMSFGNIYWKPYLRPSVCCVEEVHSITTWVAKLGLVFTPM